MKITTSLRAALLCTVLFQFQFLQAQEERFEVIEIAPQRVDAAEGEGDDVVFTIVEVMPAFPGGDEALYKYLGANLNYPESAQKAKIEGVVYVTFVVEPDGSISNAKVLRGIGGGCDEEAQRVVKAMPNWIPGTQRGKAVRVQYNLPIRFKL